MRVPLIAMREANSPGDQVYPALDASAMIVFDKTDGVLSVHKAHAIKCMDILSSGKSEFPFWLDSIFDNWDVYLTDHRIAVRNTFTMSFLRKPKEKSGKVSVGHIPFNAIVNLAAFFDDKNTPILVCSCYRNDGTRSAFTIESSNVENAKKLAQELHDRIDKWIISNNKKINISDNVDDSKKKAVADWEIFVDKAWTTSNITVFVPCEKWDRVSDNNL